MSSSVDEIRRRLSHPVIDSDGHTIEFLPAVRDRVREIGGPSTLAGFDLMLDAARFSRAMSDTDKRDPWRAAADDRSCTRNNQKSAGPCFRHRFAAG